MNEPKTRTQLSKYLGATSYYRIYLKRLSKLTTDLVTSLKKVVKFQWTETHSTKFHKIKEEMTKVTYLLFLV